MRLYVSNKAHLGRVPGPSEGADRHTAPARHHVNPVWLVRRTSADFLLVSGNRDAAEYKIFTAQQFLAILTGDDTTPKAMAVINDIKRGAISRNLKSLGTYSGLVGAF